MSWALREWRVQAARRLGAALGTVIGGGLGMGCRALMQTAVRPSPNHTAMVKL